MGLWTSLFGTYEERQAAKAARRQDREDRIALRQGGKTERVATRQKARVTTAAITGDDPADDWQEFAGSALSGIAGGAAALTGGNVSSALSAFGEAFGDDDDDDDPAPVTVAQPTGVMAWVNANPVPAAAIAIAGGYVIAKSTGVIK